MHHENIALNTGLTPSIVHLKGQPRRANREKVWNEDLWALESPLGELASLQEHAEWLWEAIRPHQQYFGSLIAEASWADVCLGCLSESAYPMLHVQASSLTILKELQLGLTFNFTCV